MTESFEEYKKRIIGYVQSQEPMALLEKIPDILETLVKGAYVDQLNVRLAPNKWSVNEIVAHLADDELVGAYRIRMILSAPGTDIQAFDQAEWAVRGKYGQIPVDDSLMLFTRLRYANLQLLRLLEPTNGIILGYMLKGVRKVSVILHCIMQGMILIICNRSGQS